MIKVKFSAEYEVEVDEKSYEDGSDLVAVLACEQSNAAELLGNLIMNGDVPVKVVVDRV